MEKAVPHDVRMKFEERHQEENLNLAGFEDELVR